MAGQTRPQLSWPACAAPAALLLAAVLIFAVAVKATLGRIIHWDIAAAIAGPGFLGLTLAFRFAL